MAKTLMDMLSGGGSGSFATPGAMTAPRPAPASQRPPAPGMPDRRRLGERLGWGDNPLYQIWDAASDSGLIEDLGYGLLNSTNFGDALGVAGNRHIQMAPLRAADDKEAKQRQEYADLIEAWGPEYSDFAAGIRNGAFDPADGYWKALEYKRETTQSQQELERARANAQFITDPTLRSMVETGALTFAEAYKQQGAGAGGPDIALQPQWFKDPETGEFVMGQLADDGTLVRTDTGGLQPVTPQELYTGRAYGAALGSQQGEAAAAAPSDVVAAQNALSLVESIRNDPELPWATGQGAALGMNNPIIAPGRFAFQKKVDQAKSGAFLTAIQEMRGMGALSNAEGQTATQAVTRMETALNEEDFLAALDEYEYIVAQGMQRAQQRMTAAPGSFPADLAPGGAQGGGMPGGDMPGGGMPTAVNPATGERMVFDGQQWVPAQ